MVKQSISKYKNRKVEHDGIKFDSVKEMQRYTQLKLLERAHEIRDLQLQKKFMLQEPFEFNGTKYREITYICDFFYYDIRKKEWIVEDTKGMRTEVYKIKKKMFIKKYGMNIVEI